MSLAEVAVVDADADADLDASSPSLSLFVHCSRISASSSKRSNGSIHVQLLDPPTLFETEVSSCHKPRALDCSGVEYVAAVETALSPEGNTESRRFEFRWSRQKRTLTLMERSEFAMKFCTIEFQVVENGEKWQELLHQVALKQREDRQLIDNKRGKVSQLETLLEQKEKLLETALMAKQKTEDTLVRGFCAVLNAKKDMIRRLQDKVDRAQEMQRYEVKPAAKRKATVMKKARKATGAKLKRKEEEDEDVSDKSSEDESEEESTVSEDEDGESELKRTKRDAVKAYSQLPANLRPSSMKISSAEDLLSSMDEIIKNEEEVNEATQKGDDSSSVKPDPVAIPSQARAVEDDRSRTRKMAIVKTEPSPPTKRELVKATRPAPPPVDETMDSEEEDILDMLS